MTKKSNENALKILEQQYANFVNLQDNWGFFRGLAEYTKTVQELTATSPIIEALERQRAASRKFCEQMNTQALKELTQSAAEMTKIAQKVARQYEPLTRTVRELQDHLNFRVLSSRPFNGLDDSLRLVARHLREGGFTDAIKRFEDNQRAVKNLYGNYTFSPAYEKLPEEERKLERIEQVEPWGAWQQLPLVKRLVFEPEQYAEEYKAEIKDNPRFQFTLLNLLGVAGEMEKIRLGKLSGDDIVFFKVKDFKNFAQRVHGHITAELLKADETDSKLDFDPETSKLYFVGEVITVSLRAESDAHELLRTIFKDRSKVWNSDEVLDDWRFDTEGKIPMKKVYHAGKAVNRIVAQDTKIKDFLDVTTKTVAINRKYLSD